VMKGDTTDFFSIPVVARWLIPKSGKGNQAAVVHDKGYKTGKLTVRVGDKTKSVPATRSAIDSMLLEGMHVLKVNRFKREVVYHSVRMGGFVVWNNYRRKERKR